MTTSARLVLHQLEFFVFLGVEPPERKKQQRITVDIHIDFDHPPLACKTDDLSNTVCYDTLKQHINNHLAKKEFHLLEYITQEIYTCVKTFLPPGNKISIHVMKFPDAFFTSAGVSFCYSDEK